MHTTKTMAPHALLIATVADVTGFDQSSVNNAAFAADLATKLTIEVAELPKVLLAIQEQTMKIDGDFAMQVREHLGQAEAGVLAQIQSCQAMLAGVGTEAKIDGDDVQDQMIDPALASAASQQPLRNGHDTNHTA